MSFDQIQRENGVATEDIRAALEFAGQLVDEELTRDSFTELINQTASTGERNVLQRDGERVAVLVSLEDFELLEKLEDRLDLEVAREALNEPGDDVRWEDLKAELNL